MGKYNRQKFKVITIGIDVHQYLSRLRRHTRDSFSEVIRRLIDVAKARDLSFSFVRPVKEDVRQFYRSGLFG